MYFLGKRATCAEAWCAVASRSALFYDNIYLKYIVHITITNLLLPRKRTHKTNKQYYIIVCRSTWHALATVDDIVEPFGDRCDARSYSNGINDLVTTSLVVKMLVCLVFV